MPKLMGECSSQPIAGLVFLEADNRAPLVFRRPCGERLETRHLRRKVHDENASILELTKKP